MEPREGVLVCRGETKCVCNKSKCPNYHRPNHQCPNHQRPNHQCPNHQRLNHQCPNHQRPNHQGVFKNSTALLNACVYTFDFRRESTTSRNVPLHYSEVSNALWLHQ